jgi:Fic family protein
MLPYSESAVQEMCLELDRWRARLDYKGPLPRAWEGRLRRDLEAESVAASTIMEGVPVTVEEVRRVLAGDASIAIDPVSRDLVAGYRDAMNFVLRRADDVGFEWTTELLVGLHDRIMGGNWAAGAGRFRAGQRRVVNSATGTVVFLPPPADRVKPLVEEACAQVEVMAAHPAIVSGWVHVAIAAIHPFEDGNGRASRVLASLAMYRGGFKRREFTSLEEWWGKHLADYYGAFGCLGGQFDPNADVTPFIQAHIRAQLSQVRALDLRERVERRIWTVIEDLVAERGLDRRVANAVWDAFFGRDVTAGYYRSLADVSPATATMDLSGAVAASLLTAIGQRRGRRYLPGDRLYSGIATALGMDDVGSGGSARAEIVASLTQRVVQTPAD